MITAEEHLKGNPYPGRGVLLGAEAGGKYVICAYFIMGRSLNSRNRVFVEDGETLYTRPFDESLVRDPSLIIYTPIRRCRSTKGDCLVVTNGDQTDTVCEYLEKSRSCTASIDFHKALLARTYEPDKPNYTPRISGMIYFSPDPAFARLEMSILRRKASKEVWQEDCERSFWSYPPEAGIGYLIHTYRTDGDPIPSFEGDPVKAGLPAVGTAEETAAFAESLWDALDHDNRISLCVRRYSLGGELFESVVINKNK